MNSPIATNNTYVTGKVFIACGFIDTDEGVVHLDIQEKNSYNARDVVRIFKAVKAKY